MSNSFGRRPFLAALASLAGIAAITPSSTLSAATTRRRHEPDTTTSPWDLTWLDSLKGRHRQVFGAGAPGPGFLAVATNWLDAHKDVYGLEYPDVNAVIGISVRAFPVNCTDAVWKKYDLGRRFQVKDPATNDWATHNIYIDEVQELKSWKVVGVRPLQARGAIFWQCNNALTAHAARIASEMQLDPKQVREEFIAGLNPGVKLVPAHTMALGLAQEHGCTYEQLG